MSGKFCWLLGVAVTFSSAVLAAEENNEVVFAKPTPDQVAWQDFEIGMFIHFAPNTWLNQEYDDLSLPLEKMELSKLDTDQWVAAAEAMGAKYIVFVAKHVGGFCMWQTATSDYGVKSLSWRGGKGDVLADLATSCRKRGIKLGVYLSPCDRKHGAGVGGRCGSPEAQEVYSKIYRQQLTEVLSRYGEIVEVWFDGSNVIGVLSASLHEPRAEGVVTSEGQRNSRMEALGWESDRKRHRTRNLSVHDDASTVGVRVLSVAGESRSHSGTWL